MLPSNNDMKIVPVRAHALFLLPKIVPELKTRLNFIADRHQVAL